MFKAVLFQFFFVFSVTMSLLLYACSPDREGFPVAGTAGENIASPIENGTDAGPMVIPDGSTLPLGPGSMDRGDPGLLVVYEKSGSLWISSNGSQVQLTAVGQDSRPGLSPDGRLVVFLRGAELWLVEINGSNPRRIYGENGAAPLQFEFDANSQAVYFTTADLEGKPKFDLKLVAVADGFMRELVPPGLGGHFSASPDWKTLALIQPGRISTFDLEGGALKQVFQFQQVQDAFGLSSPAVAWLQNGYGFKTIIPGAGGKTSRFMFIPAAGGEAATLAEFSSVTAGDSASFISPDGSMVLYLREKGEDVELHVIDASTADRGYLNKPRGKLGLLGWSPDSKNMLFWLDQPGQVWMTDGRNISALSDVQEARSVSWGRADLYFFLNGTELRWRYTGQPSHLVDSEVTGGFDFMITP